MIYDEIMAGPRPAATPICITVWVYLPVMHHRYQIRSFMSASAIHMDQTTEWTVTWYITIFFLCLMKCLLSCLATFENMASPRQQDPYPRHIMKGTGLYLTMDYTIFWLKDTTRHDGYWYIKAWSKCLLFQIRFGWKYSYCDWNFTLLTKLIHAGPMQNKLTLDQIIGLPMMTSSNGNISRVTGHLCGEFTVPMNSPHKGQWRGALMFSLICTRINGWVNNREAGDLRRHCGHYDVNVMPNQLCQIYMMTRPIPTSLDPYKLGIHPNTRLSNLGTAHTKFLVRNSCYLMFCRRFVSGQLRQYRIREVYLFVTVAIMRLLHYQRRNPKLHLNI